MADNETVTWGHGENDVVKDPAYFHELRRAIGWTSPIALFGTSSLAMYQQIESMQGAELQKRIESLKDDKVRVRLPSRSYSGYENRVALVRFGALGLFLLTWSGLVAQLVPLSPQLTLYEAFGLILAAVAFSFLAGKVIQVFAWHVGSALIILPYTAKLWDLISADSSVTKADTREDNSSGPEIV